ncbi:hypothetical protein [Chthoniobacter flavus]|uniref:hypothetical protein n=1 Tax=Chthoniobacter flavus TaxID=191863 RepID=UPI001047F95F|nr:hypothetical protein [Chthoniobacter flavus]
MRSIAVIIIALNVGSTSFGMVNNLPSSQAAKSGHVERQAEGLNRVISSELASVGAFPYWKHVGTVGMGSGVYLGDGFVLTSTHVGCYPFCLGDGTHYEPDYASWTVLKNSDGSRSDLALFRVHVPASSSLAKLGRIVLGASHQADSPVLLLGNGYTQSEQPMTFSINGKAFGVLGYRIEPRRNTAWGLNRASQELDQPVETGKALLTHCFTTQFDRTFFAGQAADGDSGGAAFAYNLEQHRWELVGCIIAVSQQRANVAFGNHTFLGELGAYASQIPGMPANATVGAMAADSQKAPIQAHPASITAVSTK